jgi:Concanavalin A-like lectin/glucanases superfamily/Lamin Tail Domain
MKNRHQTWTVIALAVLLQTAAGQAPLLHYSFSEGGAPASTENQGTHVPGLSPLNGHLLTGTSLNRTSCLSGVTGVANDVTTPYTVAFGNNSWTIGFALNSQSSPAFQYIFSENLAAGWRAFTDGAAGVGNLRMTGTSLPTIDIVGGAGESGWVHVAFVHDTAANVIRAYLDGALVSTTAAAGVNLLSGNALLIGRLGTQGLLTNNRVEEFRLYDYPLTTAQVATWADNALNGVPDFTKVMISEVSWGDPDGIEVTNFGTAAVNLANWRVRWRDGVGTVISDPLNVVIAAGESIAVIESATLPEGAPAGSQVIDRFITNLPTTSGALTVCLFDPIANPIDEVRVSDTAGAHPGWSFGSAFRGLATRGVVSGTSGQVGVERIWGLDSNGGPDWTEQPNRSMTRENRSSGPRGTEPSAPLGIKINEIDDSADYIELFNPTALNVNIGNWFFLFSAGQGFSHSVVTIPAGTVLTTGNYVVFGDTATAPTELPGGVGYIVLSAIPWTSGELSCALYDSLGRLVDIVRTPRTTSPLVHNHPRAPSHWADFVGAAGRNNNGGDDAFGRGSTSADANDGGDWFPIYTRTMGSSNASSSQSGPAGHDDVLDVRLNETGLGQGLQAIINAGGAAAGDTYNFLISIGHAGGNGPFFGLGPDALANIPAFYNIPPFAGVLDAQGSGRIDFDPGILPPGIDADFIFVLQQPGGAVSAVTRVLEFDT